MAITRLVGGLTPPDGSDPRTFPAIWNGAVDDIEAAEADIVTLEGRLDNITTDEVAEAGNLYYTDGRVETVIASSDTDDLSEGVTNLYFTTARAETVADAQIASATTDDLSEGVANFYFTDQRADDRADGRIAAATTDDLTEGVTNLYFTDARADGRIAAATTDDLTEGSTNLYHTDGRVEAVIAASDTDDLSEGLTNLYYTDGRASAAAPVQSVNTQSGAVVLSASDVGALPDSAELGDLADVDVTGVTDGQLIAYNATNDKWELASAAGITVGDITALNLTWGDF